jgi:ribosomal protein S18 acetylase RimI-like enzyme
MQVTTKLPVTIRPLMPKEESFLREMIYEAMYIPAEEEHPPREIVDQPPIRKYIADWGRYGDAAWVATYKGSLIGAAWYRLFTDDDPGYGFINAQTPELSIALHPGFRDQGVGSTLLKTLLRHAATQGFAALSLSVDVRNPAARLYVRVGFEEVERIGYVSLMQYQFCQ